MDLDRRAAIHEGMVLHGGADVSVERLVTKSAPESSPSSLPTLAEIGRRMDVTRQKLEVLATQLRARQRASQ